ncbi:HD domain-containing protein [Patescibacteria group bacterium]|nr:HD domain-containing protein [Patescibacteria group bacterium]
MPKINKFNDFNYQKKLFLKLLKKLPKENQNQIKKAYQIARKQHQGQLRSEGIPYVIHPLRIAIYLIKNLKITDPDLIIACLLHDVLEDGQIAVDGLKINFNKKTLRLVESLTRKRPDNETEEQKKINKPKNYAKLLAGDKKLLLIKAVDLLDNVTSWPYIPASSPDYKKFPRWQNDAKKYYLKIAKKAHPKIYQEMVKALSNSSN